MARLRQFIDSGAVADGTRLPSERQLQEQLQVGRSTVREALKSLEALGIVEIRHGRGVFARKGRDGDDATPVRAEAWTELGMIVEARLTLEPTAAALAARRRDGQDLEELSACLDEFDAAIGKRDSTSLVRADVKFHATIAQIGNPLLAHCLRDLGTLMINSRYVSLGQERRRPVVSDRHRAVFEAIVTQDPDRAYSCMAEHLMEFVLEVGFEVREKRSWAEVTATPLVKRRLLVTQDRIRRGLLKDAALPLAGDVDGEATKSLA